LYTVRLALDDPAELAAIEALQHHWLDAGRSGDHGHGFLSGVPLTLDELSAIARAGEAVVAEAQGALLGYFLLDTVTSNVQSRSYERRIAKLRDQRVLSEHVRVARRATVAVAAHGARRGVMRTMVSALALAVVERYDLLFSIVHVQNPVLHAHRRVGWCVLDEDDGWLPVVLDVASAARQPQLPVTTLGSAWPRQHPQSKAPQSQRPISAAPA
jgi:hypothetical protein